MDNVLRFQRWFDISKSKEMLVNLKKNQTKSKDLIDKKFMNETNDILSDETRQKLKTLSKSLLNLHKVLLDGERAEYEKKHGKITTVQEIFALVLENPHFAWLRILSGEIVLIDEFLATKKPITEADGISLIEQAKQLLSPENAVDSFDKSLQNALGRNGEAFVKYNETLMILE